MPQIQDRSLTDKELLAVFNDPRADLSLLSREERNRLVALTEPTPEPAQTAPKGSLLETAADLMPMLGGTVGGFVGKVPGARMLAAGIGGAAGEGYRQLLKHGAEIPGAVVDVARNLVEQPRATVSGAAEGSMQGLAQAALAGATQAGAQAIGEGVTTGAKKTAQAVYRGYLKPSLSAKAVGKAQQIVDTALDEALPITKSGSQTAQRMIGELRQEVDDVLAQSKGTVDLRQIADRIRAFARQRYYTPGADLSDYKAALGVAERLDAHPALGVYPRKPITLGVTASEANAAKRALQQSAAGSYGQPNATAVSRAEKEGARLLREGIEHVAPEVGPLNARESKLIDAARAIAQAVEREANHKWYGAKGVLSGAYAGDAYFRKGDSAPEAIGKGIAARVLLSPGAQSSFAILTNRIARELGVGAASAARLAAYALRDQGGDQVAPDDQGG